MNNTDIDRDLPQYKIDDFIQTFEEWDHNRSDDALLARETAQDFIKAFYKAEYFIGLELGSSFRAWLESCLPQKRIGRIPPSVGEMTKKRQKTLEKMVKDFYKWKKLSKDERLRNIALDRHMAEVIHDLDRSGWIQQGREEGREEIVWNMLQERFKTSVISKVTGLSEKKILKLKKKGRKKKRF